MSYELADEAGVIGQFASGGGFDDLSRVVAAAGNDPHDIVLKHFFDQGWMNGPGVDIAIQALEAIAESKDTDADVASTAKGLAAMMKGKDFVFLTLGESGDDESKAKADKTEAAINELKKAANKLIERRR